MTPEQIQEAFQWHPPTPDKIDKYSKIRKILTSAALEIGGMTPPSRERSMFLTLLQQAQMMANASIAIHGED